MKIARKEDSNRLENSEDCIAIEYPLGDEDINGSIIELEGRYPEEGRTVNEECKEMAFVMEGSGKLEVEGKSVDLKKGDLVLIEPGERFFWKGNMRMFMPCTPAWYPEQHKHVK
ncbi:MAG: cupin domain-containing protein [Candidatus Aenigmatarchaeota archaeon]